MQIYVIFWCYCVIFIVDCPNKSAKKQLECITPTLKPHEHTPDISIFDSVFGNLFGTMVQQQNYPHKGNAWTVCWDSMGSW